jgi:hypothetical protein
METTEIKQPEIFNAILNIMEGLEPVQKNKVNHHNITSIEALKMFIQPLIPC